MKGKTLALTDFLADESGPAPGQTGNFVKIDWAAEMENQETDEVAEADYGRPVQFDRSILPTAPKAARGPDVDMDKVPTKAPFIAFVGNLPYEADEAKIASFFQKLKVVNVRLPMDKGRLRGFGYVEFEDRDSLLEALTMNDSMFNGRKLRVDLAGSQPGGGDRDDRRGDSRDPDRTEGDWRRRDAPTADRSDRYGDRGSDRYGESRGFGDRYGDRYGDRSSSDRDRGFGDRGGYNDRSYGDRDRGFSDRYNNDRDRGYGNRNRGDRYGDQGDRYSDRSDRYSDRYGNRGRREGFSDYNRSGRQDDGYRDSGRRYGSGYNRDDRGGYEDRYGTRDRPTSRESSQDAPKERPRLQLQPRSKPLEQTGSSDRQASIFGSAKPVDTAAREREIEERLQRQKLEQQKSVEEEKENRYEPRKEGSSSSSGRIRRDSDLSSDGGSRRERRLSSSSGKGARQVPPPVTQGSRIRRDSEVSNHSDVFPEEKEEPKPTVSPKREEAPPKLVPAPPPKENVWERRKSEQQPESRSPTTSESQPPSHPPSREGGAWNKGKPHVKPDQRTNTNAEPAPAPAPAPRENPWTRRQQERELAGRPKNGLSENH